MIRIGNLYVYLKNYIMKFTKLTIAFLSVFFCLVVACGSDGINDDPKTPDVTEPVTPNEPDEPDNPSVVKVPTLQKNVQDEWKIDSIDDGFIYYNYERYVPRRQTNEHEKKGSGVDGDDFFRAHRRPAPASGARGDGNRSHRTGGLLLQEFHYRHGAVRATKPGLPHQPHTKCY